MMISCKVKPIDTRWAVLPSWCRLHLLPEKIPGTHVKLGQQTTIATVEKNNIGKMKKKEVGKYKGRGEKTEKTLVLTERRKSGSRKVDEM